ncbi:hypothetical protein F2Q70_00008885 [Brassica cretica]|nr:hypothetical protein F2Q70_00008885 [Brassica cretica]KAF3511077.1 hypothetical protein F2Q69_00002332 [Brassica cretica]
MMAIRTVSVEWSRRLNDACGDRRRDSPSSFSHRNTIDGVRENAEKVMDLEEEQKPLRLM